MSVLLFFPVPLWAVGVAFVVGCIFPFAVASLLIWSDIKRMRKR